MKRRTTTWAVLCAGTVLGTAVSTAVTALPAGAATSGPQIVISGLNNPRGLTFSGSTLYVAESGTGGNGPCLESSEGDSKVCYGATGAITAVPNATSVTGKAATTADRLISGLPSLATQTDDPSTPQPDAGTSATGPADVSVASDGTLYFPVGLGADPASRDSLTKAGAPGANFASLFSAKADGSGLTKVADLGDYEAANNPDNGKVPDSAADTNPYSVLAGTGSVLVADAGGNDVLSVDRTSGAISLVTVLPPLMAPAPPMLKLPPGTKIPAQPVPTSLATGPNGTTYVGQLTGFPFPTGGANVFSLSGSTLTPYAVGFTNVIDETVGPDGNLYVVEIAHNSLLSDNPMGGLYRVTANGSKQLLLDNLMFPGGIAFGPDGLAYLTTCSVCTGQGPSPEQTGNVVRFDAVNAQPLLTRVSGANRVQTAAAVSRVGYGSAPAVVIARSDDYADSLAGGVLASVAGGPLLLTPGTALAPEVTAEVNRLGATTAYVLGNAISDATAQALKDGTHVTNVVRVAGANRYATAAAVKATIEQLTGKAATSVYVVAGDRYADGMTVAPLAAHQVRPVLLTAGDQLPADTANALSGVTGATIVGGTPSVSASVADAIAQRIGSAPARLAGSDRYGTSAAVAKAAGDAGLNPATMWLATGRNWPDAITAGPAIAKAGGVLLLVDPDNLDTSKATEQAIAAQAPAGTVTLLGNPDAISVTVEGQVLHALGH